MPKNFTSPTQKIGQIGEQAAEKVLHKTYHHQIIETNYTKPWGEIDIVSLDVARETLCFTEVKATTNARFADQAFANITTNKEQRLQKTIIGYLANEGVSHETWQFNVAIVIIDQSSKNIAIQWYWDVIL